MDRLIGAVSRSHFRALSVLFVLSFVFFLAGQFTLQPMDRDEPRFAQASKQMLETRDFVDIRFQDEARHKKPVGIYWLQSASVLLAEKLGFKETRTTVGFYRIPSFLGAIAAVLLTYWASLAFLSRSGALFASLLMASCVLLGVEARLAKTDAVLLATVVAVMGAMARVWRAHTAPSIYKTPGLGVILTFWVAIGVGVLIKGPITPLIPLIVFCAVSLRERSMAWACPLRPWLGLGIVCVMVLPWLVAIAMKSGGAFFTESVGKDMLGKVGGAAEKHWAPPGAYFFSFWATFWPAAPLTALAGLYAWKERKDDDVFFLLAWIVPFWLVLEALPTKLPHYVLPLFPAIAILILLATERHRLPTSGWRLPTGAALMAGVPLAFLIGAPLAFWKMDGSVPAVATALFAVASVIGILAARQLWNGRMIPALLLGVVAALPLTIGGFKYGMPELDAINISRRLADIAHANACDNPTYVTTRYREPSLVFLTSTNLKMLGSIDEAQAVVSTSGQCRVLFLENSEAITLLNGAAPSSATATYKGTVTGTNINGGRRLQLVVFVLSADRRNLL